MNPQASFDPSSYYYIKVNEVAHQIVIANLEHFMKTGICNRNWYCK